MNSYFFKYCVTSKENICLVSFFVVVVETLGLIWVLEVLVMEVLFILHGILVRLFIGSFLFTGGVVVRFN